MPSDPSDISRTKVREKEEGMIRKYDRAYVLQLQRTVKSLHFGNGEEKEKAAMDIGRLLKESAKVRKLMVDLGVIPALVAMVDSDQLMAGERIQAAVRALIELANDSFL